jgi:hypothetical protein
MSNQIVLRHLEQLEAQAQLLAASIQTLRLMVSPQQEPAPLPEEDEQGNCLHPADYRQSAAGMGARHRNRFFCTRCRGYGGIGEANEEEKQ